jgi:hypothetical protein
MAKTPGELKFSSEKCCISAATITSNIYKINDAEKGMQQFNVKDRYIIAAQKD